MVAGELIPIVAFLMTAVIVLGVMYLKHLRYKLEVDGGGDYRRLAEETARTNKLVLEETTRMNATLKEIERILREV